MKIRSVLLFWLLFLNTTAWSQYADSILTAEKSDFIERLLAQKGPIHYIMGLPNKFVHPRDKFHIEKPQLLIKSDSLLFLSFSGSGRMYKLSGDRDSTYIFIRIDHTENINYNLGAHYFSYNGQLYSFGGYGFWKTNGNLKYFNLKDKQWDIVPLNEEIIPQFYPIEASWFDTETGKFFVPLQSIVNAGIKGTENVRGKVIPYSYELDIHKKQWKKLGETNQQLIEIITSGQTSFKSEKGLIILYYDKAYLVDFIHNKVFVSNYGFFNQSLSRKGTGDFVYENNGHIYSYNFNTQQTDSLNIDYTIFQDTGLKVWEPISNFTITTFSLLLITATITLLIIRRKKKKIVPKVIPEKNYRIEFTDTELALIRLLIEKNNIKERANINEINYVLGLKQKNTGLQKKVRSDTFNNINDKFRYISKTEEPLIQNIRSEMDKRYFEYFINNDHIKFLSDYFI